ncbi:MAG: tyrosine-type recombinase/integrase [Nitrospiria bacterium]
MDFVDLTDNAFTFFIKGLQGERRVKNPEVFARDANSVIAIGRNALDFLACVGRFYNDDAFIGQKGRIRCELREFEIRNEGGWRRKRKALRQYWHHHSFPTPDPKNKRLPINTGAIKKLREAILPASGSIYIRKRRYLMLSLLEITGGRRAEVAALTVDSVRQAAQMVEPMLKLPTVKRPGGRNEYRYVPVSTFDIKMLSEFIEKNRRRIIRKTCGLNKDDGHVLISETTGQNLSPNTITQELSTLAKEAGILEKVCAHMFRHRFITKLFVSLIDQHRFENEDDFRRALLDTETIKQKIQQLTGHTNLSSLDVYINLAFDEMSNFKKTQRIVNKKMFTDSYRMNLCQIKEEMKVDMKPTDTIRRLEDFIDSLDTDLEGLHDELSITNNLPRDEM